MIVKILDMITWTIIPRLCSFQKMSVQTYTSAVVQYTITIYRTTHMCLSEPLCVCLCVNDLSIPNLSMRAHSRVQMYDVCYVCMYDYTEYEDVTFREANSKRSRLFIRQPSVQVYQCIYIYIVKSVSVEKLQLLSCGVGFHCTTQSYSIA